MVEQVLEVTKVTYADVESWEPRLTPDGKPAGEGANLLELMKLKPADLLRASLWHHEGGEPLIYARPDSSELIYLLEGEVEIRDNEGHSVIASAGDFVVVPVGFEGLWITREPIAKISFSIS